MNDEQQDDSTLLAATASGDDAAFAVLVRRYVRRATLLAWQFVTNHADAEDVTQEAFIVVRQHARRFDASRAFAPWFFAIVRNLATNRRARERRRQRLLGLWGWLSRAEPATPSPESALIARLDAATAARAMNSLSPMQRGCFDLVAIRGFTIHDVAAMYGITESTVRQHVFRARAALKDQLDHSHGKEKRP